MLERTRRSLYWIGAYISVLDRSVYDKESNKKALRMFQKFLRFYREIGNRRELADSIFMIGVIHRKGGFLSSSLRKMGIALEMYRKIGCKLNTFRVYVYDRSFIHFTDIVVLIAVLWIHLARKLKIRTWKAFLASVYYLLI